MPDKFPEIPDYCIKLQSTKIEHIAYDMIRRRFNTGKYYERLYAIYLFKKAWIIKIILNEYDRDTGK